MKGRIVSLAVIVLLALSIGTALAAGPTGAIFTTTPDGGIVNENVRYNAKIEVYLDGGPGNNAPQTAAGLDDGWYVFQVTDPSGWVLLSMDPAKCRVIEVKDGVITRLVPPTEFGQASNTYDVGKDTFPCHIQDSPDGVAGPSGHHDTNIDIDHGPPAIVVQLMPFLDTPNPGGVYKAWVTYFDTYKARGGDLAEVPSKKVIKKGAFQGYVNDPGFGPPRSDQKTDNFKVKEVPPYLKVFKYVDVNGNGIFDAPPDYEYIGWKITIYEKLFDGTIISTICYTPCSKAIEPGATVWVEEDVPTGWVFSYVYVDGVKNAIQDKKIDVTFLPGDMMQTVTFGNFELVDVKACKVEDKDGDKTTTADQTFLKDWWVYLSVDGVRQLPGKQTDATGCASWTDLDPGHSYDVEEDVPTGWTPLTPTKYNFGPAESGKSYSFTFVNFKNVSVKACKYEDYDGDGGKDKPIAGWTVYLTVKGVKVDTQKTGVDGCYTWSNLGPLPADSYYDVGEEVPAGWTATSPTHVDFPHPVSGASYSADFTNFKNVSVKACKYEDYDGDGGKDKPIADWTVYLTVKGVKVDTQKTGADGCYTWSNLGPLPADSYYDVGEEVPAGWTATSPTHVDFPHPVSGASYSADFTNFKNVSIKACKVKDIDGMLVTVDDLYPVEGWTVELTKNDVVIDTQKTGVDGCYTWTNLGPVPGGWYDVHEAMVDGWVALTDKEVKFMPILSGGSYEFTFINSPMKGCTPGFWQGGNDFGTAGGKWYWNEWLDEDWAGFNAQPYYWYDDFCTKFGCLASQSDTMWHFINPDTWEVNDDFHKAARSMTAAYLNASWGIAYAYTKAELDDMWDSAYASGKLLELHMLLDKANNAIGGCPISASIP